MKEIHFQLHTCEPEAKGKEATAPGITPPKQDSPVQTAQALDSSRTLESLKNTLEIPAQFLFQNLRKTCLIYS